jgi:hypothetical protein
MRRFSLIGLCAALVGVGALAGCGGGGSSTGGGSGGSTVTGRAVNASGQPQSGATVSLLPATKAAHRQAIETTTTDVNGNFTLTNVSAGSYTISVSDTEPSGTVDTVLVTVTVPAGTSINLTVDISSTNSPPPGSSTGTVFGTVTDSTGSVLAGASVSMTSQDDNTLPVLKATTDVTGKFTFQTVPTGMWLVSVQGKHITSTSRQLVEVDAGASSEVDHTVAINNNGNGNGNNGNGG